MKSYVIKRETYLQDIETAIKRQAISFGTKRKEVNSLKSPFRLIYAVQKAYSNKYTTAF
jgi:hypothetical protein